MLRFFLSFKGRSGRFSYFMFWFIWTALIILGAMTATFFALLSPFMALYVLLGSILTMIISSFAISVRRLHDMNISGWAYPFAVFVPSIALAIFQTLSAETVKIEDMGFLLGSMASSKMTTVVEYTELFPNFNALVLATIAVYIHGHVFALMMFFWPGTKGRNRFDVTA